MASYYVWSAAAGSANGTTWANAYTSLVTAFTGKVAGDVFYVAHDHLEGAAAAITLTSPGTQANLCKIICVDRGGSVPPVSADRRTTAKIGPTSGSNNLSFNGSAHYDGLILTSTNAMPMPASTAGYMRFDNCLLWSNDVAIGAILMGNAVGGTTIELNNTKLQFLDPGSYVETSCLVRWRNTASALVGPNYPTQLFTPLSSRGGDVECIGVDLSAMGSGKTIAGTTTSSAVKYRFIDCKLNAAVTKSLVPSSPGASQVDFIRSGSAGVNYTVHSHRAQGLLIEELTIVRTGGASDGTTPLSWKVVTTANCSYSTPFECPVIAIWNDTTGSAKTATVEGIWGGGAVPNDDDVWIELEYLGDASSPQGSFVSDGKIDLLATAAGQTTSTAAWGAGSTTKFKLNVTFTAQLKGWIYCRVKCAKASSTFYIDPLVTLT
jgi:hypothetical protein